MSKAEIIKKMNEILISIFEDNSILINESTKTNEIEGWDSICKMMFVENIENILNIKLSSKDLLLLNEFGPFADAILEKLNNLK